MTVSPLAAATVNLLVLTAKFPVTARFPGTARLPVSVVAPVTLSAPPMVAAPLVARLERLVAPVTPRVPAMAVLPLAAATVSLLVATLKSPVVLTAALEIWSAESLPLPSLMALSVALTVELSVFLSRPV